MFEELIDIQRDLQKLMGYPGAPKFKSDNFDSKGVKEMLLAAMVECSEALGEVSWKPWKPEEYKTVDKHLLATELTDIIQFVINAAIYANLTAEDLDTALRAKWQVNIQRIKDGDTTSE